MLIAFATTILLGAALLFVVQPMVAKMLLPLLGGTPSVWNTCLLFFQGGLLAGYAYAHVLTRRLRPGWQVAIHVVVLATPLLFLPLQVRGAAETPDPQAPIPWLLAALAATVGLPFFVVSTTGPLLQRWLATTDHRHAQDPYFLYAASNLGSLGGLLLYPLVLERALRLRVPGSPLSPSQSSLWSLGYVLYAVLAGACGLLMLRHRGAVRSSVAADLGPAPTVATRSRWVLLAFVPSSLLLGVTQHLTAEIAPVPLLWTVPLALYLSTFVVAFSSRVRVSLTTSGVALALLALAAWASLSPGVRLWLLVSYPVHLLTLVAAGLLCHGRLAAERPATGRLTEFYFLVALGGVLGGAFNALVAPLVFSGIWEYPLAIFLALLLRAEEEEDSGSPATRTTRALDFAIAAGIVLVALLVRAIVTRQLEAGAAATVFAVGIPGALCLAVAARPLRFALALGGLLLTSVIVTSTTGTILHRERTFFAVHRVQRLTPVVTSLDGGPSPRAMTFHCLLHGATAHGTQCLDPAQGGEPTSYFHRTGPIGQLFRVLDRRDVHEPIAVVGLGVGTLAAYGAPGQPLTFYEIDPAVVRIARDSGLFTYLRDSRADVRYVLGDGRLSLQSAADGEYGLIVLDAFNSDAVPVHLLTREAFALYLRKLRTDGLLVVQLTNQYLAIERVVAALASDAGLAGIMRLDMPRSAQEVLEGKEAAMWSVLARDPALLAPFLDEPGWGSLPPPDRRHLWMDDYSSVISLIKTW